MYRRIRKFLLVLVASLSLSTVRAATDTVDYTSQLSSILSILQTLRMRVDSIWGYAESIDDCLWNVMAEDLSSAHDQIIAIRNILALIKPQCDSVVSLLESSVIDLNSILSYVTDSSLSLQDLKTICDGTQTSVINIDNSLMQVLGYLPDLSNMSAFLNQIYGQLDSLLSNGELNKEETQRAILNVLTGITDTADSIKEALDIIQSEDGVAQITDAIAALKQEVTQILYLLNSWDTRFFRYLYDRTYPNPMFEFYRISGSPFFENGYLTYNQPIGPSSALSFVDWLASALTAHTEGLQVINDNLLFIARTVSSTNTQEYVSQFQEDGQQYVESVQSEFDKLSSITYTEGIDFDPSQMKLDQVNSIFDKFKSNGQYTPVRHYNMDWSGITDGYTSSDGNSMFTTFDFQYDLTAAASFIEYARVFFTVLWTLMFASVFLWICFLFRRFYNWLFQSIAGNIPGGSSIPSMPIPK